VCVIGGAIPVRPDRAPHLHRTERRWLPPIAILALIVFVTAGARGVEAALADPPGPAVVVGRVRIDPRPGWTEEPGLRLDEGSVHRRVVTRGGAALIVTSIEGRRDDARSLATEYLEMVLRQRFVQLRVTGARPVTVADALPGVRFAYLGVTHDRATVEGVVTAATGPAGDGVIFDALSPEGTLAGVASDVGAMIDGARVG
jgi:hypothetical protein